MITAFRRGYLDAANLRPHRHYALNGRHALTGRNLKRYHSGYRKGAIARVRYQLSIGTAPDTLIEIMNFLGIE